MGSTNFNPAFFMGAATGLASTERQAPVVSGSSVTNFEASEANLLCSGGQPEKIAATVTTALEEAAVYTGQQPRDRHSTPPFPTEEAETTPLSCGGKRAFSDECQSDGPPRKRQKTEKLTIASLPNDVAQCIFPFVGLKDQKALFMTCRSLRTQLLALHQPRCQFLRAADAKQHLLAHFGIKCPGVGAASPARMEIMVTRVKALLEGTKRLLGYFPGCALPKRTAEELVLEAAPGDLVKLLKALKRFNFFYFFRCCETTQTACKEFSKPYSDESSLKEAERSIRTWLSTEKVRKVSRLCVQCVEPMYIPPEIGRLENLQSLDLSNGCLRTLPTAIGQLANLESLFLGGNSLHTLPGALGRLTKLKTLYLEYNQLSVLPPTLWELVNLERLALSGNQLVAISTRIRQLKKLQHLDLSHNRLSELPAKFWQLARLAELKLGHNRLTFIPAEIGRLTNLQVLGLAHNHLSLIPPEVGGLVSLVTLDLADNSLATLPIEIGRLRSLKWFFAAGNHLDGTAREIIEPLWEAGTTIC